MTSTQILDWAVSLLTMGSYYYASLRKERVDTSLQLNSINVVAGILFAIVGFLTGLYGLMFRQLVFGGIALHNLVGIYRIRNKQGELKK
jgi:hypothetical protein